MTVVLLWAACRGTRAAVTRQPVTATAARRHPGGSPPLRLTLRVGGSFVFEVALGDPLEARDNEAGVPCQQARGVTDAEVLLLAEKAAETAEAGLLRCCRASGGRDDGSSEGARRALRASRGRSAFILVVPCQ